MPTPTGPDGVRQQVLNWQSRLIELNKRNPLYCLPANGRGLSAIAGPDADTLSKILSSAHRHLLFTPLPETDNAGGAEPAPAPKRKANHLELPPEEYKKLNALRSRALSALREQGINILFVAIGALEWVEPNTRERLQSPLILVPVTLERLPGGDGLRLIRFPDDIERNPTLAYRLSQTDIAETLPEMPEEDDLVPSAYLDQVRALLDRHPSWAVTDQVVLGRFSFQKMAMYRDLDRQLDAACSHSIIEALAGNTAALDRLPEVVLPDLHDLDRATAGEKSYSVLDADPSQQRAVLAAKRGQSFVLQGPPGTGKSQTIANIIAECIADGKRVLFVSQKMAALDAVFKRLRDRGLHDLCLEAHSHKANKKEILEQLRRALQARVPAGDTETINAEVFEGIKSRLDEIVEDIGKPRLPLGISIYDANGHIAAAAGVPDVPFTFVDPQDVDEPGFHALIALAERLARHSPLYAEVLTHPWRGIKADRFSLGLQTGVRAVFGDLAGQLPLAATLSRSLAAACGTAAPDTVNDTGRLIETAGLLAATPRPPRHWLTTDDIDGLQATAEQARARYTAYNDARASLSAAWSEAVLDLPHAELLSRLSQQGCEPLAAALGASWPAVASDRYAEIRAGLMAAAEHTERLDRSLRVLAAQCGLTGPSSIAFARHALTVAGTACADIRPLREWFAAGALPSLSRLAAEAAKVFTDHNTLRAEMLAPYDETLLRLDLPGLAERFTNEYASFTRHFQPAFYRDRRTVRQCLRPGVDPASRDIARDLAAALRLTGLTSWIDTHDAELQRDFGIHYTGAQTDWAALRSKLDTAAMLLQECPGGRVPEALLAAMIGSGMAIGALRDLHTQTSQYLEVLDTALQQLGRYIDLTSLPFTGLPLSQAALPEIRAWLSQVLASLEDYDAARGAALNCRREGPADTPRLIAALTEAQRLVAAAQAIAAEDAAMRGAYASRYEGAATNWDAVLVDLQWADALRAQFPGSPLPPDLVNVAVDGSATALAAIAQLSGALRERQTAVHGHLDSMLAYFPPERLQEGTVPLADAPLAALKSWLQTRIDRLGEMEGWIDFQNLRKECADAGLLSFFETAVNRNIPAQIVVPAFRKRFFRLWHDAVCDTAPALRQFRGDEHNRLIAEFCRMDRTRIEAAPQQIRSIAHRSRPTRLQDFGEVGALKKMLAQKRTRPILKMLADIPNLLFALKPCLMMSPLSVSLFLDSEAIRCDIVIFDEASQIFTEDAVCSLLRGKQVVIAGDTKQLPPTSFFKSLEDDSEEDEEATQYESVLQAAATVASAESTQFTEHPLTWHYRSRHDSLIAFSKKHFYEHITAFPSPTIPSAVRFTHVPDGIYYPGATKRNNPVEAARVVDLVLEYARTHPGQSLGVITFNESQKSTIEAEAEARSRDDAGIAAILSDQGAEGFFVKNIENVQGDERDAIFLSIGFGRTPEGRLSMNFGPINTEGGERRLNVAVTRARHSMMVVSSILPADIDLRRTDRTGPKLLREYLEYAQSGGTILASMPHKQAEFEAAVETALRQAGLEVGRHIGRFEYAVDLAIRDPDNPDEYLLGIECDSEFYRNAATARERDRLRGSVLKDLGWRLHRVWSVDWVRSPEREVEAVLKAVAAAGKPGAADLAPETPPATVSTEPAHVVAPAVVRETGPAYGAPPAAVNPPADPAADDANRLALSAIPGVTYFEPARLSLTGGRDAFYEETKAAQKRRCALVLELVDQEGPLPVDIAVQRLAAAASLGRAGSRVREIVDDAIEDLIGQEKIEMRHDFLYPASASIAARIPRPGDTPRPIEQISLEEIGEVALAVLKAGFGMRREELVVETGRVLGYRSTGVNIRDRINEALSMLELDDRIHLQGNQVRPLE